MITVELDGLPGENKRPKDSVKIKERLDQYDEKVVPIAYEEPKEYIFPSTDLLTPGTASGKGREELARSMQETADKLKRTLQDFGVGVTITNISRGPSVTRYELQPEQGVRSARLLIWLMILSLILPQKIFVLRHQFQERQRLVLKCQTRKNRWLHFVIFWKVMNLQKQSRRLFLPQERILRKNCCCRYRKMPHLLIAGQTGSGKSVCINTIIMSILYKARPSEVKLIMIDPKVVELSVYNGIPHLLIPVVTDPKKAAAALNWAVNEMEERYKKFAEHKARNIIGYNAQIDQIEDVPGKDRPEKSHRSS